MKDQPFGVYMPATASLAGAGIENAEAEARISSYLLEAMPFVYTVYVSAARDVQMAMPSSEEHTAYRLALARKLGVPPATIEVSDAAFRGFALELEVADVSIATTDSMDSTAHMRERELTDCDALWLPDMTDGRPGLRLRFVSTRDLRGSIRLKRVIDVLPIPRGTPTSTGGPA